MEITKREILISIAIICIMLVLGIMISGSINDKVMDAQDEYNKALKIDADKELFEYGMETNVGNAFVYGDLKAVGSVTFEEIGGEYTYVEKVKERYTQHSRTVTKTRTKANGETETYTEIEYYWTWDPVDSWDRHVDKIKFMDVEFDYGTIPFPDSNHITTIRESYKIRYVYSGVPIESEGTMYAVLGNNTVSGADFYHGMSLEEAVESAKSIFAIPLFWIIWVFLTGGVVWVFYSFGNYWLEDRKYRSRRYRAGYRR